MDASQLYFPGWREAFTFVTCFSVSVVGTKITFPTKMQIACQMVKELPCDGLYNHSIASQCELLRPRAISTHGKSCCRNDQCRVHRSVCHHGVCLCKPGVYFSPNQNKCLRKCAGYGNEMDYYKGISINGHNTKALHNISLTGCFEKCVQEETFTCLTLDWKLNGGGHVECMLSRVGYLDVFIWERESGDGWNLLQRRCK